MKLRNDIDWDSVLARGWGSYYSIMNEDEKKDLARLAQMSYDTWADEDIAARDAIDEMQKRDEDEHYKT